MHLENKICKMLKSVDYDEKTTRKFCTSGSDYQAEAWFLTEDGLYEVLMQSRKPVAKEFKKELLYRHSINLNARKTVHLNNGGGKNKKTLDFIHDDEIQQAISTAVSLCMDNNIDISDIIEKKAS